jgi:hypothetical protein
MEAVGGFLRVNVTATDLRGFRKRVGQHRLGLPLVATAGPFALNTIGVSVAEVPDFAFFFRTDAMSLRLSLAGLNFQV